MNRALFLLLLGIWSRSCPAIAQTDTFRVAFSSGRSSLSAREQASLDSLIYNGLLQPGRFFQVVGYADSVGNSLYNKRLSTQRAKNVRDYLLQSGFDKIHILSCTGYGEIVSEEDSKLLVQNSNRKVEIIQKVDSGLSVIHSDDVFVLDNIEFEGGRHVYEVSSIPALQQFLSMLRKNERMVVQLEGHICCTPPDSLHSDGFDNDTRDYKLSFNRAKFIADYLIGQGIQASRVRYKGFGATKPLPGISIHDAKNRRVEVRILSK